MRKIFIAFLLIAVLMTSGCIFRKVTILDIGKLKVTSGKVLISDPLYLTEAYDRVLEIDGIPQGNYDCMIHIMYFNKDKRIVKSELLIDEKAKVKSKKLIGKFVVESATGCFIDKDVFNGFFDKAGKDRIGEFYGQDHLFFANKIKEEFGYDYIMINDYSTQLIGEVSEKMEQAIKAFLMYQYNRSNFFIKTNNTFDKIIEGMEKKYEATYSYADVLLDKDSGSNLLAFSTGFGDGEYDVNGYYDKNGRLVKIELDMSEKPEKETKRIEKDVKKQG